jgi:hypothetical protein
MHGSDLVQHARVFIRIVFQTIPHSLSAAWLKRKNNRKLACLT